MEVGFQVILCNRFLAEIDVTLLACLLVGNRGQSVTEEVIAKVERLYVILFFYVPFREALLMTGYRSSSLTWRHRTGLAIGLNERLFKSHVVLKKKSPENSLRCHCTLMF